MKEIIIIELSESDKEQSSEIVRTIEELLAGKISYDEIRVVKL
jgi:hypothetical protein